MSALFGARARFISRAQRDARTLRLLRGGRRGMARPTTDVVIEGYPRSGNTFSAKAFRMAQAPREIVIAHHQHTPAQFQIAARHGIPAMCLVRDPVDAVASLIVRDPRLPVDAAIDLYTGFYRRALDFADAFVVCPFEEVTSDFGACIERLNARFGTDWKPFQSTPENVEAVFEQIRVANRERRDGRSTMVAAPSADREGPAQSIREAIRSSRHGSRLAEAYAVYRRLVPAA
jgi:hypothetical protein